jgi:hypothetical protein
VSIQKKPNFGKKMLNLVALKPSRASLGCLFSSERLSFCETTKILAQLSMEQNALKNECNSWNAQIVFYLESSRSQICYII